MGCSASYFVRINWSSRFLCNPSYESVPYLRSSKDGCFSISDDLFCSPRLEWFTEFTGPTFPRIATAVKSGHKTQLLLISWHLTLNVKFELLKKKVYTLHQTSKVILYNYGLVMRATYDMLDLKTKCCPRPKAEGNIMYEGPTYHMLPESPVNNCFVIPSLVIDNVYM